MIILRNSNGLHPRQMRRKISSLLHLTHHLVSSYHCRLNLDFFIGEDSYFLNDYLLIVYQIDPVINDTRPRLVSFKFNASYVFVQYTVFSFSASTTSLCKCVQ